MVKESTKNNIKGLVSLLLGGLAYYLIRYQVGLELAYSVGGGLLVVAVSYLILTEKKAPKSVVSVGRWLLGIGISGYLAKYWYDFSGSLEQTIGIFLILLFALYILIVKGFEKGGGE